MTCKKIQGLLKSDYLDGELSREVTQEITEHLKLCADCRRLKEELEAARMLFQKATRHQPPERVWQNIREAIIQERLTEESRESRPLRERVTERFWLPRPAFALASVCTAIVLVVLASGLIKTRQPQGTETDQQNMAEYRLGDGNDELASGLGTTIEEYFL